jgi:mandelate racemase
MAIPPTPRDVSTRAVRVPLTFALGTSAAIVRAVPLLLVDLGTEEGLAGRTYLFCYTPSGARAIAEHIREALELVLGKLTTPLDLARFLQRRFALLGVTGTVRMALSAIDMAFWDALAQSLRSAAFPRSRRLATAAAGLRQPGARADGPRRARRRGGEIAGEGA